MLAELSTVNFHGITDKTTDVLLAEYQMLQSDARQHLNGEIEEGYCDELANVEFALIRKYFESYGLSEMAVARCVKEIEWEPAEVSRMVAELR